MRGPAITGTCRAGEVFDGQRWLSQAPGHGDLLRSTSDVQVCPYVPAVAGLRSRDTYGYLCTFACTWHRTWICTPTPPPAHGRRLNHIPRGRPDPIFGCREPAGPRTIRRPSPASSLRPAGRDLIRACGPSRAPIPVLSATQ